VLHGVTVVVVIVVFVVMLQMQGEFSAFLVVMD
jgi:hypothetical protein